MIVVMRPGEANETAKNRLRGAGYSLIVSDDWEPRGAKTLFLTGAEVPFLLLEAGWHFLDRWDVAAPLWRYGVLAQDVGGPSERERTEAVTKDLRLLLFAHELLFVRDSEAARRFLEVWRAECEGEAEPRLAFLRALHLVKPLFCALPRSWLRETVTVQAETRKRASVMTKLVHIEIAPGRYVCCRPDEVEMYRQRYAQLAKKRGQ